MKGFVQTPIEVVDFMVDRLFRARKPTRNDNLLDPGCGTGAFLQGVNRWCTKYGVEAPHMVGIESDHQRAAAALNAFEGHKRVEIRQTDFLATPLESFDFIVGNPPYVPITGLDEDEKRTYRVQFDTARGRFDLYLLFFERALKSLRPMGRLVLITPEKFLYVESARELRRLLCGVQIEEIRLADEDAFGDLTTYPAVTTIVRDRPRAATKVFFRDGTEFSFRPDGNAESWMPLIHGFHAQTQQPVLASICERISCGVATGADRVFVLDAAQAASEFAPLAHPTIAGRELVFRGVLPEPKRVMLVPYAPDGKLIDERSLGPLQDYLCQAHVRKQLLQRTCVQRKPWYAFHETPRLTEILKPKILCKDITHSPGFWIDREGKLIPRHSVYYIVPRNEAVLENLYAYLNSETASAWLSAHCQRAANGFLRLQSQILKRLPIPQSVLVERPIALGSSPVRPQAPSQSLLSGAHA